MYPESKGVDFLLILFCFLSHFTVSHPTPTFNRFSLLATLTEVSESVPSGPTTSTQNQPKSASLHTSPPAARSARMTRRGQRKRLPRALQPSAQATELTRLAQSLHPTVEQASLTAIVTLCPMEFMPSQGWQETPPMNSPTLPVKLEVHYPTYASMNLPTPRKQHHKFICPHKTKGVADTGAQTNIIPTTEALHMNIDLSSLLPVRASISGASNGSKINIFGGVILQVKGLSARSCSSLQLFYVADNVTRIYLSTLKGLGVQSWMQPSPHQRARLQSSVRKVCRVLTLPCPPAWPQIGPSRGWATGYARNTAPASAPSTKQTVFIGISFCHQAEQNYATIEREATAAAWAANICRFFLLSLKDFLLSLDHKPLIPIQSKRSLAPSPTPDCSTRR